VLPDTFSPDAVLSALVLAPHTLARNRFFALHDDPRMKRIRRRAKRVRGVVRQLVGKGRDRAEEVGRHVLADDRVLLRYTVETLSFARTVSLTGLEAALVAYALHRAAGQELTPADKERVEAALAGLGEGLALEP
jgi:hypothetical protein